MLKDKQEAKFGGVMSVQNTHVIPASLLRFSSIYTLISALLPYILFLGILCITSEYGGFQKLCGDAKKKK